MGPPWAPPGTPDSTMRKSKSYQKSTLIFDRFLEPKLGQNGRQNLSKIDQKSDWFVDRFLDAILIPKCSPKWLPKPSKTTQKSIQNRIWPKKRDFLKNITSPTRELHFWGFRLPKTLPKLTKNGPRTIPKSDWNFDRILNWPFIDFGSILAPKIHPKWVQKWSKKRTKKSIKKSLKNDPNMDPKMERRVWVI